MLSVGTYGQYAGSTAPGFTVVFDKSNKGQIFSTEGNLLADMNNTVPVVTLGVPVSVNMNGITLTENAIPITMGNTAYILDKVTQVLLSMLTRLTDNHLADMNLLVFFFINSFSRLPMARQSSTRSAQALRLR